VKKSPFTVEVVKKILILSICIEAVFFMALVYQGKIQTATVLVGTLNNLTNSERQQQNLSSLKENILLDKSAQFKADDMVKNGYFAHKSPDGKEPWYWLDSVGYKYSYAGENLAINFNESEDVVNAWMNSPTHKANIVKGSYTEIGTAIATGTYKGKDAVFVVQHYASPRVAEKNIFPSTTSANVVSKDNKTGEVLGVSTVKEKDKKLTDLPISKKMEVILLCVLALLIIFAIFFRPILRFFALHSGVSNFLLFAIAIAFAWVLFSSYFAKGVDYLTSSINFLPDHTIQTIK
jgi:hypothetical protein